MAQTVAMPRTKKPAGQAVDRRNGRSLSLGSAAPLARFGLPRRDAGWDLRTRRMWKALWDDPVSSVLSVVDRELVTRWAECADDWLKAMDRARGEPTSEGSTGQLVKSPWFGIAEQALRTVESCEAQIGVGALNRARLGLTFAAAVKSLAEVNRDYGPDGGNDDDELDPRLP